MLMYQLVSIPPEAIAQVEREYRGKHDYVKAAKYVQDYAGLDEDGKAMTYISNQMRKQLATILLQQEKKMTQPDPVGQTEGHNSEVPEPERPKKTRSKNKPDPDAFPNAQFGYIDASGVDSLIIGNHARQKNIYKNKKNK